MTTPKKKDEFVGPPEEDAADFFADPANLSRDESSAATGPADTRTMQEKLESKRESQIAADKGRPAAVAPRPGTQAYVDARGARYDAAAKAEQDAATPQPIDPNDIEMHPGASGGAAPAPAGPDPNRNLRWGSQGGGGGGM